MMLQFFLSFILVLPAHSLFVLLPLYVYPGNSASAWSNVFSTVAAYRTVQWQIVINPNSGPGTYPPDANYIQGVATLRNSSNVKILGYVDTAYTKRSYSAVVSDINTYAQWSNYPNANIAVDGIFFDDCTASTNSASYSYMRNVSAYAYATIPSAVTPVVFNPGQVVSTTYFDYCDTMIEFEGPMSSYKNQTTINTIPAAYRPQTAIIVYNTPTSTNVASLVHTMAVNKIEAVYFTTDCCYNAINATLLKQVAAAVAAS